LVVACGFMESLKDISAKQFRKPSILQGRKGVVKFLVYWWWMESNGTQN